MTIAVIHTGEQTLHPAIVNVIVILHPLVVAVIGRQIQAVALAIVRQVFKQVVPMRVNLLYQAPALAVLVILYLAPAKPRKMQAPVIVNVI